VLMEVAGKPGWWAFASLLSFIPFIGWIIPLVVNIIALLEVAKRFGKSTVFAIFGLVIFGFVGFPILGFGDAKYNPGLASPTAPTPTTPAVTPPAPTTPPPAS
jgi:hypothetical protein